MAHFLKPLGIVALLALAGPALAQDATGDAQAPATNAPAADGTPALDLGTGANAQQAQPKTYVAEVFDDWSRECTKQPSGKEECYIMQLLKETPDAEKPIGKVSMRRLPEGQQAIVYGEVIMPLGVVLPEHLAIQVDSSPAKVYDFRFCLPIGCVARLGFTADDIAAFKKGAKATITVAAEGMPGKPVKKVQIEMGLKGFTKAYETLEVPPAPAAANQ